MNGYAAWVQLLALQCRMSRQRRAELLARLDGLMEHGEDHVEPIGPQADILRFRLIGDVACHGRHRQSCGVHTKMETWSVSR